MHSLPNILLALVLVGYVHSTCYDYWKGDSLPSFSNNSYCRAIIRWAVSDQVIAENSTRDAQAIAYYKDIYNKSYLNGAVGKECLGMIQYIACAAAYPTCSDSQSSIPVVCSWLCELMAIRCGTTSDLYTTICVSGKTDSQTCSAEAWLLLGGMAMLLFFILGL